MLSSRLRPEPLAIPFVGLLLVLLLGSAQYANNLGFFFSFWLAALAGGGLLGLRGRLGEITTRVLHVDSGFEDDPLHLTLELRSPHDSQCLLGLEADRLRPAHLPSGQPMTLRLPLPERLRGVHTPGSLYLTLRDRLGLVRVEDQRPLGGRHWVFPAPRGGHPLPPPEGETLHTGHEDFSSLRDYQPGDSPSRIHWASLARGGTLQTRQFSGHTAPRGPRMLDEALLSSIPREARLRQLCAWVLECEQRGEPYALRLNDGGGTETGLGADQRLRCLRLLAEAPRT
ncbi:MAG: DUF58 domain-containing protein [Pseudomonadota bacterium]